MKVEIWSDVVCPWCYLGKRRFERALESFEHRDGVDVVYRSFELDPAAPVGSTTPTVDMLSAKYGMSPADAHNAQRQMEERAAADGLTFRMSELRTGNTRAAHRLLHLAKDQGRQADLAERLHQAYFTDGKSVFDTESLTAIATATGLDGERVRQVLDSDEYDAEVAADEAEAHALGANGVPFFVIDRRYGISGAQLQELFEQALAQAWTATD